MIAIFETEIGAYVLEIPKYLDLSALKEAEEFLNLLEEMEERMVDWSTIPYRTAGELKKFIDEIPVLDWVMLGKVFQFLDDMFVKKIVFYYQTPYSYKQAFVVEDIEYDWDTNKVKFEYDGRAYEFPVYYIDFDLIRRD